MARVMGWSPTEMREYEENFAALVSKKVISWTKWARAKVVASDRVLVAAGGGGPLPSPPIDLGAVGAITGLWNGTVAAEIMPALSEVYLRSASTIWQGIDDAFDELVVPPVTDVFADEYLARAKNRLVGIGDAVWAKIREELVVGFSLGESTEQLAQRVSNAGQLSLHRASVIARTEVNYAANLGAHQQVLLAGLTGTKEWLDTNDERTRCTHRVAGGQTVDVTKPFTLGGPTCGTAPCYLQLPGDPTAPPSEIIQCRCSVAYDLELPDLEPPIITAAAEVNTGGMIALIPTAEDANRLVLTGAYAEPATELHTTLLFLGEASEWGRENRRLLTDVVAEIVQRYVPIATETFSVNIFNPGIATYDTAVVLGVRGTDLLIALHDAIATNVADIFDDEVPTQHTPWIPHITLSYTDELTEVLPEALEKVGPVTFDRVRVVFAGETTDFPLEGTPMTAAADPNWDESKVKRDSKGQFAKKAGKKLTDLVKLWSDVQSGAHEDGTVLATGFSGGKKWRLVVTHSDDDMIGISEQYLDNDGIWLEDDLFTDPSDFTSPFNQKNITDTGYVLATSGDVDVPPDLDAVPPAFTKDGGKTKYTDPAGVPGLMVPAADPGKSGDGYVKKADGTKGPWGKYGAAGVMLRHRGEDGVDRYLLVQRGPALSSNVGKWQLPGGGLDSNETAIQGATREIIEELGLNPDDVAKGRVHGFHEAEVPGVPDWKYTSFAATVPDQLVPDLSGENAQLETGDAQWLTLEEIQALDDNGDLLGPLAGGKWHDQIVDLFPDAEAKPAANPPMPSLAEPGTVGVESGDFSKLKKISGPKGSNEGGIYEAPDGSRWYVKKQKSAKHALNERNASALYRAAGIYVPEVFVSADGTHTATRIIPEGTTKLKKVAAGVDADALAKVRRGFAVDALLANWDVAGLEFDNILFDGNGNPHRIDVGGALEFRAQGAPKGSTFGVTATEWDSLRDPKKNPQSAKLFTGMTNDELAVAVAHVQALTPEKIREILGDGPLADKIIKRRENLLKRAENDGVDISVGDELGPDAVDFEFVEPEAVELDLTPHVPNPVHSTETDDADFIPNYDNPSNAVGGDGSVTFHEESVGVPQSPSEVWQGLGTTWQHGDVVATGAAGNGYMLRIIAVNDPNSGGFKLVEEEHIDGEWHQGRVWYDEDSLNAADLSEYTKFQTHKLLMATQPGTTGTNPYTGEQAYVPVGPAVNGDKNVIWDQFTKGMYADGDVIADFTTGEGAVMRLSVGKDKFGAPVIKIDRLSPYDKKWHPIISLGKNYKDDWDKLDLAKYGFPTQKKTKTSSPTASSVPIVPTQVHAPDTHAGIWERVQSKELKSNTLLGSYVSASGYTHELRVSADGKSVDHWTINPNTKALKIKETFSTEDDFLAADLSLFQKVTTKPAGQLKQVPKLTNAVIYGKYQNGDVIAGKTVGDHTEVRIVYQDNKLLYQTRFKGGTGKWSTTAKWGKGEAYKQLSAEQDKEPWFLGDAFPEGSASGPLVTSAPKPKPIVVPTPPTSAGISWYTKKAIKKKFDASVVKWHTAAPTMLEALVATQVQNPDLTLGQILAVMDETTKTSTSPTPFTDKITKYLGTAKGKAHAKAIGLPSDALIAKGTTNATAKIGTSTPKVGTSAPKTSVPSYTGTTMLPTHLTTTHEFGEAGSHAIQAPPGGYKIHSNSEMTAIQQQMHKQHGSWTSTQQAALKKYTGSAYSTMNKCLRKPTTCTSSVIKDNENAAAGMRPLTTAIRVTRGTGWGAIPGLSSSHTMSDAERLAHLQAATGKLLTEPAFMSTSSAATPAFGGALRFIIDVPAGTPAAWVKNISHYGSENELLLAPGLKYRIKKVEPGGGGYGNPHKVYLEVVYP